MTKFQIVSDLHIEYRTTEVPDPLTLITPSADVLILAGDIGSFYQYDQLKTFLVNLCPHFKVVIYVPGNHEYYTVQGHKPQKMNNLLQNFIRMEKSIDNLYILNRSSAQIEDVCIVGCTLWSDPKTHVPKFIVRIPVMNTRAYSQKHEGGFILHQKDDQVLSKERKETFGNYTPLSDIFCNHKEEKTQG